MIVFFFSQKGIACLLQVMKEHIETVSRDQLTTHNPLLFTTFTHLLDVRNQVDDVSSSLCVLFYYRSSCNLVVVLQCSLHDVVEEHAMAAVTAMVVRLSEVTFRPLYFKFFSWAIDGDDLASKHRRTVFFKLSLRY